MSTTGTFTASWTLTQARYVTSKIAADLDLMRTHYGQPSVQQIADFDEEAARLLARRVLGSVEYGFKRSGVVVFALKYFAQTDGTLVSDDRPGRVPAGLDMLGTQFYSYLTYAPAWTAMTSAERAALDLELPIQRSDGPTPQTSLGYWEETRSYSANGSGVRRQVFKPI